MGKKMKKPTRANEIKEQHRKRVGRDRDAWKKEKKEK